MTVHDPIHAPIESRTALTGDALVAASGIDVVLGGRPVLSDVDITVREGEIVTLIGPNGAGKTTLVRVMLGLVAPTRGRVRRRPGLRVGYVPQRLNVDPVLPLTARRFLSLGPRVRRDGRRRALELTAADKLLDRPFHGLSGGELRRVLLARALLREPDLLVLDEPAQGVDLTGQAELYDLIAGIRAERGCGILLISHDLHLVMRATDRVVCLNRHVCCAGLPGVVSRHPEYLALFGPRVAQGLAVYAHHHDHRHDAAGNVVAKAEPSDG